MSYFILIFHKIILVGGDACFYEQMASNKYGLEEMPIPVKINAPQECTAIFLGEC